MIAKKNQRKSGHVAKTISFFVKKRNKAKARFQRKTTSLVFKDLIVKTFLHYLESLFVDKLKYAFSYALKNNFIILNLVRTFFNFDNLLERNLHFVINK